MGNKRLDFLDVARGVAASLIVLEHGLHLCLPEYRQFSKDNIVVGQAGILVLFMISGFVVPMSLEEGGSIVRFWKRRFFRLFPVYWFSIFLAFGYLVCGGTLLLSVSLDDSMTWIANLLLFQGILGRPNIWEVFWSMHFELLLYAVFSALFGCRLLIRMGAKSFAVLLVGLTSFFSMLPLLTGKAPGSGDMRLVILAAMSGFIANRYVSGRIGRKEFYATVGGVFASVMIVWSIHNVLFPTAATYGQLLRYTALMGLAYGSFTVLLELRNSNMPRTACWLGRRSYPIYLVHPFVLLLLNPTHWPVWVLIPCLFVATLLMADAVHRFIERPGIALGRKFEKRRKIADSPVKYVVPTRRAA